FDHWTREDFWSYAAFFGQLNVGRAQQSVLQITDGNSGEVRIPDVGKVVKPRYLGVKEELTEASTTRRDQLANWVASAENPYFAKATVNRVWASLFGIGLVDPVDDFGSHNASSHPEVLELLAADFAEPGFNLRRLFRVLTSTRAYQLSSDVEQQTARDHDPRLFRSMAVKSLTAEQIYHCVDKATCRRQLRNNASQEEINQRMLEKTRFLSKFEAPTQRSIEFQAGIPQMLTMINGEYIADATNLQKSDLLASMLDSPFLKDQQRIDILFLATVSRYPDSVEKAKFGKYVTESDDSHKALADILWALLNSSEFLLNH
ncbi:MAG: hypothetical protein CMJ78_18610, partial [Planctomycetaceae bacterium]|nr:hypothetical protein [Planctomycetaceae bacterium]